MGVNDFIKIGNRIKNLRLNKGISQKDMAEKLSIPRSTYSNYENDNREPNIEMIDKIAKALDISVIELLGLNTIEKEIDKTFREAFNQFISDKRYLLDIKKYKSIEEYNNELENLYNATIEFIEFYCYKLNK